MRSSMEGASSKWSCHGAHPRIGSSTEGAAWSKDDVRASFAMADADKSAALDKAEVKALLTERGLCCSDGYIEGVFECYDADSSGTINAAEFEQLSTMVARRLANGGGFDTDTPPPVAPRPTIEIENPIAKRPPPSLQGVAAARGVATKLATRKRPPPTLPSAEEAEEIRRQAIARTEAEQAAVVAKSEQELLARKAAMRERANAGAV